MRVLQVLRMLQLHDQGAQQWAHQKLCQQLLLGWQRWQCPELPRRRRAVGCHKLLSACGR